MDVDRTTCTLLCHQAASTQFVTKTMDIFLEGSLATDVYFTAAGLLEYRTRHSKERLDSTQKPSVVAEGALWCRWKYFGRLTAISECELVLVHVATFQAVCRQRPHTSRYIQRYARLYVLHLQQLLACGTHPSDTSFDDRASKEMARKALGDVL